MKNMLDEAWGVCYYNTRFVGQAVKETRVRFPYGLLSYQSSVYTDSCETVVDTGFLFSYMVIYETETSG